MLNTAAIEDDQSFSTSSRPGKLMGDISIDIHTYNALDLVRIVRNNGANEYPGPLIKFAGRMRILWNASAQDDPFADWYMEKTQQAIMSTTEDIHKIQEPLDLAISSSGMNVELPYAKTTVKIPMEFGAPYGFMGAMLIMACDKAIRTLFLSRHIGLINTADSDQNIDKIILATKQALKIQLIYHYTGITREDARQKNAKWSAALESMGTPPKEIIAGRRPEFSPRLKVDDETVSVRLVKNPDEEPKGQDPSPDKQEQEKSENIVPKPTKKPVKSKKSSV